MLFLAVLAINALVAFSSQPSWWMHLNGSSYDTAAFNIGLGAFYDQNWPGSRSLSSSWGPVDGTSFYAGFGSGANSSVIPVYLNDIYEFDISRLPEDGQFRFLDGDEAGSAETILSATPESFAAGNRPGARYAMATWTKDQTSPTTLLLFGGWGHGTSCGSAEVAPLCDTWEFELATWNWRTVSSLGVSSCTCAGSSYDFGTKDTPLVSNIPPPRVGAVSWTTHYTQIESGGEIRYFMFGGFDISTPEYWNDLWELDIATYFWMWRHGESSPMGSAVYGTPGMFDTPNVPPALKGSCGWVSSTSSTSERYLYLFGGTGYSVTLEESEFHNGLWQYDVETNFWRFLTGTPSASSVSITAVVSTPSLFDGLSMPGSLEFMTPFRSSTTDDYLYFFGGNYVNARLWIFDTISNYWKCVDTLAGKLGSTHEEYASPAWSYGSITFEDEVTGETYLYGGNGYAYTSKGTCRPHRGCGTKYNFGYLTDLFGWMLRSPISCYGADIFDLDNICYGHGECVLPDTCDCMQNYTAAANCSEWDCYGISRNNLNTVCSGNGTCIGYNDCDCLPEVEGEDCSIPKRMCEGIRYDLSDVCNSRGDCSENGTCVNCQDFNEWRYTGRSCAEGINEYARFVEYDEIFEIGYSVSYVDLSVAFPQAETQFVSSDGSFDCSTIFTPSTLERVGVNSKCRFVPYEDAPDTISLIEVDTKDGGGVQLEDGDILDFVAQTSLIPGWDVFEVVMLCGTCDDPKNVGAIVGAVLGVLASIVVGIPLCVAIIAAIVVGIRRTKKQKKKGGGFELATRK